MQRISCWLIAILLLNLTNDAFSQGDVTVRLSVIEIDSGGERPAVGTLVIVFPKNQGVANGYTDSNGNIAFKFNATESVTFRVGRISESIRLQPLSGRISQTTSCIVDRREAQFKACACSYGFVSAEANGVMDVLNDVEVQAGGRLMDDQTREYLKKLRNDVIELTNPPPNADDSTLEQYGNGRTMLLDRIDSMLSPPWRMRAGYESRPSGALITEVAPNGPAAQAGLIVGDVVTHVNSMSVRDSQNTFAWMIANCETDQADLEVVNGNSTRRIQVTLIK